MSYKSRIVVLGLPLVHVATGWQDEEGRYRRGIARGWIAIGDISFGVLLSIGALAFGGIALGGLGVGVLPVAGLALGVWAVGGGALGYFAVGGGAVAFEAALGGLAVARDYALGGAAFATHANDEAARQLFAASPFFSTAEALLKHTRWLILLAILPLLLSLRKRLR